MVTVTDVWRVPYHLTHSLGTGSLHTIFLTEVEPFMLSSVCRWQEGSWEAVLLKEHVVLWRHRLSVRLHYGQLNTLLVFYQKEMII